MILVGLLGRCKNIFLFLLSRSYCNSLFLARRRNRIALDSIGPNFKVEGYHHINISTVFLIKYLPDFIYLL